MAGTKTVNRREFMARAGRAGAAAVSATVLGPELMRAAQNAAKIKVGLIGCGGRGVWIAKLFQKHGGYEISAVADYFKDRADEAGAALGVPESRRFTGLSGYKRLLDAKVDAVAIETPPYFHPEQAAAAVDAGAHVYLAKPVAVDVPGCGSIAASGAEGDGEKARLPRRLPDAGPPVVHRGPPARPRRRPGRSPLRRGHLPRRIARGRNITTRSRPTPGTPRSGSGPGASTGPSPAT